MTTRTRPAWDLSLKEIDARADQLARVDRFFRAEQQQARADANTTSGAEQEAFYAIARNMTVDQIFAYSKAEACGLRPDIRDYANARADAAISRDGLRQITTFDQSGRPIHTFESVTGRKDWMSPYRNVPGLMIAMTNNVINTRRQAQRYLSEHPAAIPM